MAGKKRKLYLKDNMVKILLLIIVIWLLVTLVQNQVRSSLIQTETVKKTVLEHIDTGYGLLHGQETVINAPADGAVERTMAEGQRVRKGNAVFRAGGVIAYTNDAGYVSYRIDGLEGTDDLNAICSTDLERRYGEQQDGASKNEETDAVAGSAYAKVINTFDNIYLYVTVPSTSYTAALEADQKIPLRFTDLSYEVTGSIVEVLDTADGFRYLKIKLRNVKETVFQQRIYKMELPYDRISAIAVPTGALVEKDGAQGVYYLQKGFVFWKNVTVGQTWEDQGLTVIEEGLDAGDMIVTTPQYVREGENIKF